MPNSPGVRLQSCVTRILRLMAVFEANRHPVKLWMLAERFGVTTRSIRRDLKVMEALGWLVETSGPGGPEKASVRARRPRSIA